MNDTERFYTPGDIAALTRLHPKVIRRTIARGQLGGYKLNGRWRVSQTQLDAWLAAGLSQASAFAA
jgi:excisionase family DNA binding protein